MIKQNCNIVCRILAPVLVLVLLVCMITVTAPSAAAADLTDKAGWINLLDYTTVESASNFFVVSGTKELTVSLPYQTNLFYVDMVLYVNGSSITSAKAMWNSSSNSTSLDIYSLGNGLFRVYGSVPSGNYSNFKFSLTSSGTAYVTCQSLRVCTVSRTITPETGYIYYKNAIRAEMSSPGQMISYTDNNASNGGNANVRFNVRNWYKYDALELIIQFVCDDVNQVHAYVGDYYLPVELSYFLNEPATYGNYYFVVTIDLTDVPRDLPYDLTLNVTCIPDSSIFPMYLHDVYGITYIEPPSPLRYWFSSFFGNLSTWFTNVINTVNTGFSNVGTWLSSGFQSVVNKLDELINGSSDGTSDQIKDDLGSVGDFEDRYHDTVEGNWGDVSGSLDQVVGGSNFIGAASFYSDIVQTIFESVPDYGVVLTAVLCVFVVFSLL